MSFSGDLALFAVLAVDKIQKVKRLASFDVYSNIINSTPVDTGALRSNWVVSNNRPFDGTVDAISTRDTALNAAERVLDQNLPHQSVFITNNLPYAARIEYDGYSSFAPDGMVRINIMRWPQLVAHRVRQVSRE